ncbi:type VI secretion system tip protein VgrG, partial [Vibrio sp. S4M6]
DRYSKSDDKASCWVRVAQGWAGSQYGMMALPRIGHEVIVSFLEGDPDQPIITGRTFNALNVPPYKLPDNKTRTVFRTDTHQGEGFNELRFEDQNDKQEVFLRAQKNLAINVLNSKNERVEYNSSRSIGNDDQHAIARNQQVTIQGQQDIYIKGNQLIKTDADQNENVAGDWLKKINGTIGVNADGSISIKSGKKITFQVGESIVALHKGGVDIRGKSINLNSGGSANDIPLPQSPTMLKTAAGKGSLFVANCKLEQSNDK